MKNKLSKPVAEVVSKFGDLEAFGEREIKLLTGIQKMAYGTKFYSQEYVYALQHESAVNWEAAASLNVENEELKRANKAQDDHINQQQDRIESLEKKNSDLGQALGVAEKRLATLVIGSRDSDPMREYFTCTREGDFYFTTLGSVPDRTYTLYRNEAEALFIGLREALSASPTVGGGE